MTFVAEGCDEFCKRLRNMTDFTAVTIRQHPEGRHDRLVGAFMLIEGESYLGEPLLIIRGLNPIENFINKVEVEEFYEAAISYVKNVAKKMEDYNA